MSMWPTPPPSLLCQTGMYALNLTLRPKQAIYMQRYSYQYLPGVTYKGNLFMWSIFWGICTLDLFRWYRPGITFIQNWSQLGIKTIVTMKIPNIDLSYASKTEYHNSGLINSSVNQTWQYFENSGAIGFAICCVFLIILFLVTENSIETKYSIAIVISCPYFNKEM